MWEIAACQRNLKPQDGPSGKREREPPEVAMMCLGFMLHVPAVHIFSDVQSFKSGFNIKLS